MSMLHAWLLAAASAWILSCASAHAEQLQRFGDWEVHYVVLPTEFLKPDVAAGYNIVRGRDRAFVNVSVLDPDDLPTRVTIAGHSTNLLGQRQPLAFREVSEGNAVYYIAEIKHSNEEVVRFEISITGATSRKMLVEFQQKLYWEQP